MGSVILVMRGASTDVRGGWVVGQNSPGARIPSVSMVRTASQHCVDRNGCRRQDGNHAVVHAGSGEFLPVQENTCCGRLSAASVGYAVRGARSESAASDMFYRLSW